MGVYHSPMPGARWRPAASSLRTAFVAAAAAWAGLLVAATFAASRPHATAFATALIVGVYGIGSAVCHQLPERSYQLWHAQMPVCARCAGIYAGAAVSAVIALAVHMRGARGFQPSGSRSPACPEPGRGERLALHWARPLLAVAVTPTLVTLAYEWTTGIMPSHAIRAAAGLPIGIIVAWLVVAAADNQVN